MNEGNFAVVFLGSRAGNVCGTANDIRAAVPEGWHPLLEIFLKDVDITEMTVTSLNLTLAMSFRRRPGAVAEPKQEP